MATQIFNNDGFINFSEGELISSFALQRVPFDEGSVWEALKPGEELSLSDGDFILDKDMNLVKFVGYDDCGEASYRLANGQVVDGFHQKT